MLEASIILCIPQFFRLGTVSVIPDEDEEKEKKGKKNPSPSCTLPINATRWGKKKKLSRLGKKEDEESGIGVTVERETKKGREKDRLSWRPEPSAESGNVK